MIDAFQTVLDLPMDRAETAVRAALGRAGFGVLTEIDVAATLKARLDVERPGLKILGACNPTFAHRALALDPSVALVLPCNVVLSDAGDGRTTVAVTDPRSLIGASGGSELQALGEEAAELLRSAVDGLAG